MSTKELAKTIRKKERAEQLAKRKEAIKKLEEKRARIKGSWDWASTDTLKEVKHIYHDPMDQVTKDLKDGTLTSQEAKKKAQDLDKNLQTKLTSHKETQRLLQKSRGGRLKKKVTKKKQSYATRRADFPPASLQKNRGGRLGIDNSGQDLVQKLYNPLDPIKPRPNQRLSGKGAGKYKGKAKQFKTT